MWLGKATKRMKLIDNNDMSKKVVSVELIDFSTQILCMVVLFAPKIMFS